MKREVEWPGVGHGVRAEAVGLLLGEVPHRATAPGRGCCASSHSEWSPFALGFKHAISPCFCRKLVKQQIAQPTKCNGLYDLKQMLDSVAWIALPLQLSYFEKNDSLKFHFGKRCFLILLMRTGAYIFNAVSVKWFSDIDRGEAIFVIFPGFSVLGRIRRERRRSSHTHICEHTHTYSREAQLCPSFEVWKISVTLSLNVLVAVFIWNVQTFFFFLLPVHFSGKGW